MIVLQIHGERGDIQHRAVDLPLFIGRDKECTIVLDSWRVARRHAQMVAGDDGIHVLDLGSLSGTRVNGERISSFGPLDYCDEIAVGPFMLKLATPCKDDTGEPTENGSAQSMAGHVSDVVAECQHEYEAGSAQLHCSVAAASAQTNPINGDESLPAHRLRLHQALLDALDLRRRDIASLSDHALREEAVRSLSELIKKDTLLPASLDKSALLREVVDEAVGLGVLEPLLTDPDITEIMVNRHDEIFIEKQGCLSRYAGGFSSEQAVRGILDRIVSPLGRRVDESSPMVDARLKDGSRINAVIPPIALRGASLTIRKFPRTRPNLQDILRSGALDLHMSQFLALCVQNKKNMVISGGTGSGKTTLLNVLSNCIGEDERVVTIEDAAELRLNHAHLVSLEARPANPEGRGRVDTRDLVRNALRMRPDRIVIGECRGAEAFDMLTAMNTGHAGSLTTLHANSPRDALTRLETMVLMAGMDLPLAAIREHIAASIDFIIQQTRLRNGHRLISGIVEVTGMESGRIQTQDIFSFSPVPRPAFSGCGVAPDCFLDEAGRTLLPLSMFTQRTELDHAPHLPPWVRGPIPPRGRPEFRALS